MVRKLGVLSVILCCAAIMPACGDDDGNTDKATETEYSITFGKGNIKAGR